MIIFLEATNMIIKRLEIKNLHGIYNYNVSFNDDLTFIFGENGCGKTTILDIVSSIVTGRLYNLFSYDFDEIVLSYRKATIIKWSLKRLAQQTRTLNKYAREYIRNSTEMKMTKSFL